MKLTIDRRGQTYANGARAGHSHGEHQDHGFEDPFYSFRQDHEFEDPYDTFRRFFGDTDPFELVDSLLAASGATSTTRVVTNVALRLAMPLVFELFQEHTSDSFC